MKLHSRRSARLQRGTTTALFALGMIPMVGIMALAIELGNVAVHTKRLQNYVDSKAVAGLKEDFGAVQQDVGYHGFMNGVAPAGGQAVVDAVREKGHWSFSGFNNVNQFTATNSLSLSAGSVPAYRFVVDPLTVNLMFGPLFNVPSVDIRAEAIAYAPRREVVIVIDQSGSMATGNRMAQAQQAATSAVTTMANQAIPGDLLGVLAFSSQGATSEMAPAGLRSLTQAGQINSFINGLSPTGGTDIPTGLNLGYSYFGNTPPANPEVERILILIGDGPDGNSANQTAGITQNAFSNSGVHTYAIAFCGNTQCGASVTNYYGVLPAGNGTFQAPQNPAQLGQILGDIIVSVSMKLVR
jgi:hypothetical protein